MCHPQTRTTIGDPAGLGWDHAKIPGSGDAGIPDLGGAAQATPVIRSQVRFKARNPARRCARAGVIHDRETIIILMQINDCPKLFS